MPLLRFVAGIVSTGLFVYGGILLFQVGNQFRGGADGLGSDKFFHGIALVAFGLGALALGWTASGIKELVVYWRVDDGNADEEFES